jgi:hypothetical protein
MTRTITRRSSSDGTSTTTIGSNDFGTAESATLDIPDRVVVIRSDNPTNSSVVCYGITVGEVFCFIPWITGG